MTIRKALAGIRARSFARKAKKAAQLLERIDRHMIADKWPAWKRKQFWRDFVKRPSFRYMIYNEIQFGGQENEQG